MTTEYPYRVVTADKQPALREENSGMSVLAWPEFMLHDPVADYFNELYDCFPQHQFGLVDPANGDLMCIGNSVPLAWDGDPHDLPDEGWDWALEKGIKDHQTGRSPTILCAIQIMLPPAHRSKGLSAEAVRVMKEIGQLRGLSTMIAPVRPSAKHLYPLTDAARYIEWQTDEGLPFDPWLRVHVRQGGEIIKVCPRAMRITGSVAQWEKWTEMCFPDSGTYVVPGALAPVEINREADQGVYIEPNIWTVHTDT